MSGIILNRKSITSRPLVLLQLRDLVFSYHSLNALFRVYEGDHLQIVSGKKIVERCLIQMLRGCDHVGAHNVLDLLVAGLLSASP